MWKRSCSIGGINNVADTRGGVVVRVLLLPVRVGAGVAEGGRT